MERGSAFFLEVQVYTQSQTITEMCLISKCNESAKRFSPDRVEEVGLSTKGQEPETRL